MRSSITRMLDFRDSRQMRVQANPLRSTVMDGAAFAKENGCDFIVALGGGSVMDASKAMAAMVTNEGDIWDYMNGGTGGGKKLTEKALPVICITTTAGTGSEADQWVLLPMMKPMRKSVLADMTVCSRYCLWLTRS